MLWGQLKPLLTSFIMPQLFWLTIALLALAVLCLRKKRTADPFSRNTSLRSPSKTPIVILFFSLLFLWIFSSHGTAVLLSKWLLPTTSPIQLAEIEHFKAQHQQGQQGAIVVLGAGVQPQAAEYNNAPALSPYALERLVYGIHLSQKTGWPIAYSGGRSWIQSSSDIDAPEATAAQRTAQELGTPLQWIEAQSRDTQENAQASADLLHPQGITHIILVTQAWHMPRAQRAFENAGFTVTPAPVGFIQPYPHFWQEWLPSSSGITTTSTIIREWIGLRVQAFKS